ncbi:MAG: proline iminopeptidase-family hydrolase [Bacteroidia bacterium]|nr:proline iminopeptidase-family hydrolase [Bacteroidia bacterium]
MSNRRQFLQQAALGTAAFSTLPYLSGFAKPSSSPSADIKTGGVRMITLDNGYRVWTKKIGKGKLKMLTLHGGPGCTHEYFECFEDFLPQQGIEFYYYDQLGSEYSDKPTDTKLWHIDRFTEEVEQVRKALNLDQFVLYGQSWGGMLGIEYALKYQQHLQGLIISNMTASIPSYLKYINELRSKFGPETEALLQKYEKADDYNNPEYQKILIEKLYNAHICRVVPWPEPVDRMFRHMATPVYNTIQGNNEFVVTGNFGNWDRWNDLSKIKVPTYLTVGKFDTMREDDIRKMASLIPNSSFYLTENGSHLSMWDDQESYFKGLLNFLSRFK